MTAQHADVISGLAFGVLERKGYLALTAEAGLGKTTALRALSRLLQESNVLSSVIFAPRLTPSEFLEMALLNFGFQNIPASKAQRLKMLDEFLANADAEGKICSLIVDEAHELSPDLLEEIRLLGNFESAERKLLQIVLAGQNQLNDHLNLPQLWQLKQRITLRLSLKPLDREAVEAYINFRWNHAGGSQPSPFTAATMEAVAAWSKGVPRLINVICDNALLIAFSETDRTVDAETIRAACEELSFPTPPITRAPAHQGGRAVAPSPVAASPPTPLAATKTPSPVDSDPSFNAWVAARPSLLRRWFGLTHSRAAATRSKTVISLLKEP